MDVDKRLADEQLRLSRSVEEAEFNYDYPVRSDGSTLDLRPKSKLHQFIISRVNQYCQMSRNALHSRYEECRKIDEMMTVFVPLSSWETAQREKNAKVPVATVVPRSYAARDAWLSFMDQTFAGPSIHRYSGVGSRESQVKAALRERVVARQSRWFKERLHLNTVLSDAFTYGIGICSVEWSKHHGRRFNDERITALAAELLRGSGIKVKDGDLIRYTKEKTLFEGSKITPLDFYHLFWDPNVSPNNIQDAEWFGWLSRTNAMAILRREDDPEEFKFNGKYVRLVAQNGGGRSSLWNFSESGRSNRYGGDPSGADTEGTPVDEIHLLVTLIPREWALGDEERPERWKICVSAGVVTELRPLALDHGMYPIAAFSPTTEGHLVVPVSLAGVAFGMQKLMDWWVNSRVQNVMTSVNVRTLVDFSKIEEEDILNPNPGQYVRVKQSAYGENGLRNYAMQLPVNDVTQAHMGDLQTWMEVYKEAIGIMDITQGDMSNMPERPGQQGVSAAMAGAMSRQRRLAAMLGMQGMEDLAWQFAYNTDQFMDMEVQVQAAGRSKSQELHRLFGDDITVNKWDLDPNWDIIPYDGSMPEMDNMSEHAEVVKTMMGVEGVVQEFASRYDIGALLAEYFKRLFPELEDYQLPPDMQAQVLPDEQIQAEAQAGNIVPMDQMGAMP